MAKKVKPQENPLTLKLNKLQKQLEDVEKSLEVTRNLELIKREIRKIQQELHKLSASENIKYGLPSHLWILNSKWEIRLVDGLRHPNGFKVNGLCCFADKIISLETKNKAISQSFIHEIIHGIDRSLGVEEPNKEFDEYKTKVLASCWDSILLQVLKANVKGGVKCLEKRKK